MIFLSERKILERLNDDKHDTPIYKQLHRVIDQCMFSKYLTFLQYMTKH